MVRLGEAKQFSNKALNKPLTKPLKNGLVSGLLLLAVACSDHALEFSLVTVFVFMSICFIALIIVHCYNSEVNILGRISAAQPHRLPFLYVFYVSMHCVYLPTLMLLCSHGDLYTSKIW